MSPMNHRLMRPRASGGFDPRSISNLAAWYDAADTSSVTLNGSNVSQLSDKSGNGRNATQGSAALQPAYSTAKYNGKNVVTNAATKVLTFSVPLNSAATVFLVCSRGNIVNTRALCGNASGAAPSFGVMIDAAADFSYYTPSGDTTTLAARDAAATGLHVMSVAQTDSVNLRAFFNGTQRVSRTPGLPFAPYALTLLGATFSNGNQAMNGDIAELLVYHKVLSDSERSAVTSYLGTKWGITVT